MPWPMQEHIRACKLVGTPVMANEWVYSVSTVLPVKVTDRATLRGLSASQRPEWPLVQHALQKMPSRVLNNPNARRQVQPAQGVAAGKVGPSAYAYLNAKLGHGRRGKGNLAIMSSQPPSTRAIDYRVVPHIGDPHMPYPLYLLRCMKMAPDMASATERTKRLLHPSNENIATHYSEWLAQVTRGKPSLVAMLPAQVTCIDDTLKIRWVDPSRVHQ